VSTVVHKTGRELDDPKELLLGFLDYYRSVIIRKIDGLTGAELRANRQAGRWPAGPGELAGSLIAALHAAGEQTRAIASAAELTDISTPGGRFRDDDPRPLPTLAGILTYVLQEYARHAGHLDVAREVIDGTTGELPGVVGARGNRTTGRRGGSAPVLR
jgi:hypothetical protein